MTENYFKETITSTSYSPYGVPYDLRYLNENQPLKFDN